MQAVILAAGRGTRLHPITENRTKAMCPVAGKPMIERVMDTLAANGISDFILVISPDDPEIMPYFEEKSRFSGQIQFVEQKEQLGMGHALLQAAPLIQDDFILSSCDNLVDTSAILRMLAMWAGYPPPNAILALLRVGPEELVRMGVVEREEEHGRIVRIVEKPTLEEAPSNLGSVPIYLFSYNLVKYLSQIKPSTRGEYELQDAIQELIDKDGDVYGLLLPKRIDLTHPADLLRLNLQFLASDISQPPAPGSTENGVRYIPPVIVDADVTLGSGCVIGPNVYIENGADIQSDVHLENCVVLRNSQVETGTRAENQVLW